ncbi:MAG: hypothetical protein MJ153_06975, partial [Clostridia bacterium]|nr:hypothetical protein [Clostridia bacterium]
MNIFSMKKNDLKNMVFKKPFGNRMALMLIGVFVMGICVALLRMCHLGTDPFAAFSYGFSDITGIDFGTTELLLNGIMLFAVLFSDVSRLGFGTLGNMILVGYTADFTTFVINELLGLTEPTNMVLRIVIMLIALAFFVMGASLYINAGLGSSPYDALPYIIHNKICRITHKSIAFKFVRIGFDAVFTIASFFIHGEAGIITVLMVLSLGPVIDAFSKLLSKILNTNTEPMAE